MRVRESERDIYIYIYRGRGKENENEQERWEGRAMCNGPCKVNIMVS